MFAGLPNECWNVVLMCIRDGVTFKAAMFTCKMFHTCIVGKKDYLVTLEKMSNVCLTGNLMSRARYSQEARMLLELPFELGIKGRELYNMSCEAIDWMLGSVKNVNVLFPLAMNMNNKYCYWPDMMKHPNVSVERLAEMIRCHNVTNINAVLANPNVYECDVSWVKYMDTRQPCPLTIPELDAKEYANALRRVFPEKLKHSDPIFTQSMIEKYEHLDWIWEEVMVNPNTPWESVTTHYLPYKKGFSWDIVVKYDNLEWDYSEIFCYVEITEERLNYVMSKGYDIDMIDVYGIRLDLLRKYVHDVKRYSGQIHLDDVLNSSYEWDVKAVMLRSDLSGKHIVAYPDFGWDWNFVSKYVKISAAHYLGNTHLPWNKKYLKENPSVSWVIKRTL